MKHRKQKYYDPFGISEDMSLAEQTIKFGAKTVLDMLKAVKQARDRQDVSNKNVITDLHKGADGVYTVKP